jgi:hypothetical protein
LFFCFIIYLFYLIIINFKFRWKFFTKRYKIVFMKREKSISKMEGDFHFYFMKSFQFSWRKNFLWKEKPISKMEGDFHFYFMKRFYKKYFFTKREKSISKMEGDFHFYFTNLRKGFSIFFDKTCFYEKRKIKNKNGRSFPFLFYKKFSNFLTKCCFYKKRKINNKNGRWLPFLTKKF